MSAENPLWGQRRVQAELARLGFPVSARTVAKYMRRPYDGVPSPCWRRFLTRRAQDIWACDFFGVRTVLFRTLYVFFVMHHETRQILQVRVTRHPTADWAAQQVVEACAWDRDPPRYLIRDRDSRYGKAFDRRVRGLGARPLRTPVKAPRANALAERWVRSVRNECLDQVWIVNERHLPRVLDEYVAYFNAWRPHRGLGWANGRRADRLRRPSSTQQAGSLVGRCLGACTMCISMQPDGRMELLRPTAISADPAG
jgi:putative transposase